MFNPYTANAENMVSS